ncbi:MAG: FtsX-like permease family protein [Spirochaetales bacterium]
MFAKLALLNILKHAKRSAVVFGAVAVAVVVLTIAGGVIRGLSDTVLASIIPTAGHVVITEAAAQDAANPLDLKYLIPGAEELLATLHDERIAVAETILTFPALLVEPVPDSKKEARNVGLMGQGVRPDTRFLSSVRAGITAGSFLPGGQGVALSNRVAKLLGVSLGGTVMVLTTDRGNNPWYQELPITGLFNSGSEQLDLNTFVVSQETARELVDAADMSREIRILLRDPETAPALAADLSRQLEGQGLRVLDWQRNFAAVLTIVKFLDILFVFIRVFFVIVAGSVITNSILMTVFERTREYGTLRAIGLKKRQLRAMILTEGALLGGLGSLAGLAVGIPLVLVMSVVGLDLGSATEYVGFSSRIYPLFSAIDGVTNLVFGTLIALAASWYASRVSSRLSVNQLLSHT